MPDRHPNGPCAVLAAFVEALVEGRRVVVFGDASSPLSERLLNRGARLVHVCDADPARLAVAVTRNATQHVSYTPLTAAGLTFREGAFDLGLVEDLSAYDVLPPEDVLRLLRRAVSTRGAAIIASRNPHVAAAPLPPAPTAAGRHLDYYELYDLVSAEFDPLRMFGQMPFVGYSMVEFGRHDEPEPVVDTTLVPGGTEEPQWFVAVGGEPSLRLDSFVLVQLPGCDIRPAEARGAQAETEALQRAERAALRVVELDAELVLAKEQLRVLKPRETRQHDMDRALKERDEWIEQLEARASVADERADTVQAELETLELRLAEAERSSSVARDEAGRLQTELDSERSRAQWLQRELEAERTATDQQEAVDDEVSELERQLVERGKRVLELERRLREAQHVGRELIAQMELRQNQLPLEESLRGWEPPDGSVPQPVDTLAHEHLGLGGEWGGAEVGATRTGTRSLPELGHALRDLAVQNAELSADLEAAGWVVTRLRCDLSRARSDEARLGAAERSLARAQGCLQSQAVALQSLASPHCCGRVR